MKLKIDQPRLCGQSLAMTIESKPKSGADVDFNRLPLEVRRGLYETIFRRRDMRSRHHCADWVVSQPVAGKASR
jgi:hypothetical protein